MNRSCAWLVAALFLLVAPGAFAFPTWMGVYGEYKRHDGGNPGKFTVLMNQDYAGLRAKVGVHYVGATGGHIYDEFDMAYKGNVNGNSIWECALDPVRVFPSGGVVQYWFRGYQDGSSSVIYDNAGGSNYSFTAKAPISLLKFRGELPPGNTAEDLFAWSSREGIVHSLYKSPSGTVYRALTEDGWSNPTMVDPSGNSYYAQIAANGQSIFVWHNVYYSAPVFKRSLDGGATFTTLNVVVPTGSVSYAIAGYGTSSYVLVYAKTDSYSLTKISEVSAMTSHDNGSTWTAPIRIAQQQAQDYFVSVNNLSCIREGSTTYVTFVHDRRNERASGNGDLYVASSSDNFSWDSTRLKTFEIGRTQPVTARLAAGDGRVLVSLKNSYTDMLLFRRDGANWAESALYGTYQDGGYESFLSCGPGSLVTVVFPSSGYSSSNLSYFVSADGGVTFGPRFSRLYPRTVEGERDGIASVIEAGDRLLISVRREVTVSNGVLRLDPVILEAGAGIAESVAWVGNTHPWPPAGQISTGMTVWINTESWKQGSGERAAVVYSVNGGAWASANLTYNGKIGNNDGWHGLIGPFNRPGDMVRYAVAVIDSAGTYKWDSMNGQNYQFVVNYPIPVYWVGNTYSWPANGQATANDSIWINCESYQKGGGVSGIVVYTTDGHNWQSRALSRNGTIGNNDRWNINLGKFAPNTTIRFAVMVQDAYGAQRWDSNGGNDYRLTIR